MRARLLDPDRLDDDLEGLAGLLVDAVSAGASVGFLDPLSAQEAADFWQGAVRSGGTLTWVADEEGDVVGCVQLKPVQLPNGRHRGEVAKLLVHRRARRRGLASTLLKRLEEEARRLGLTLLLLDTETGSPAEALYRRIGYEVVGTVADFARSPDGRLGATTFMTKRLGECAPQR